ncbi:hypothetical protein ACTA71_001794 [Dictyostelium dimigraforme]
MVNNYGITELIFEPKTFSTSTSTSISISKSTSTKIFYNTGCGTPRSDYACYGSISFLVHIQTSTSQLNERCLWPVKEWYNKVRSCDSSGQVAVELEFVIDTVGSSGRIRINKEVVVEVVLVVEMEAIVFNPSVFTILGTADI